MGSQLASSCGTNSPRSTTRMRALVPASACSMVPPPAPLPTMTTSNFSPAIGPRHALVDLIHQPLILDGALEAHLGLPPGPDRGGKVAVHRAIPADVLQQPGNRDPAPSPPAHQHDRAVGLEGDDALAAIELRHAQAQQ